MQKKSDVFLPLQLHSLTHSEITVEERLRCWLRESWWEDSLNTMVLVY